MSLLEIPLTIMDISITPDEKGWKKCCDIVNIVEEYEGVLTLLWHHTFFSERDYLGWIEIYKRIIKLCKERNGWIANDAK